LVWILPLIGSLAPNALLYLVLKTGLVVILVGQVFWLRNSRISILNSALFQLCHDEIFLKQVAKMKDSYLLFNVQNQWSPNPTHN